MENITVLIADDHLVVREGLQLILGAAGDFTVVGAAPDGATAVRLAGELQPAVVLMDLRMPGMGGLEAISLIRANWPDIAIVILTTYNEDDLMLRGLQAGASGFLLKDTDRQTLFNTIRAAARGESLLQPEILSRILTHTNDDPKLHYAPKSRPSQNLQLTERENEVLQCVAEGQRSKEVALALGVTERTIKAHLTNIYNKLGVDSRAAAVAVAMQRGLISANDDPR